ncbi:MAG TPA: recombinase A [Polyangia bacterium]|nr:recombinase A [Polyangia bacterium]
MRPPPQIDGVRPLSRPGDARTEAAAAAWSLGELAGRLCELGGGAALTLAFRLVLDAQERGEPAAWLTGRESSFFPPDAEEGGVDLDALVVVRAPDAAAAARAADQLARSGAFGLLVLDVGAQPIAMPLLARLLGLAQKHDIAILFLADAPLGSLISLRGCCERRRRDGDDGLYDCELRVIKDKRRAPGWTFQEVCRGPAGLR